MTVLARTRDELLDARTRLAEERGETAVVMTMGALHAGHAQLMRVGREVVGADGSLVVTLFVNPLQFSAGEDLDRYPRTLDADLALCRVEGVDLVFAPSKADVYPGGDPQVSVDPGPLGAELEGAARPGHFSGMLTVVAKLMGLTVPAVAVFGEKDYQQLVLVRRMVDDLDLGVEVIAVPTVRDDDGLALSSRNRYLTPAERARALALPLALEAGAAVAYAGAAAVLAAATAVLERADRVQVDYLALRDPELFPAPETGAARLLVAARIGAARLIDNAPVVLGAA